MPTLTAYPVAGSNSPVDGETGRADGGVNESFASIRAGAGNTFSNTTQAPYIQLRASAITDQYNGLYRDHFMFDTSAIAGRTVTSAILYFTVEGKQEGLGYTTPDTDLYLVASTAAATNTLAASDYGQVGTTSFGQIAQADITADNVTYNALTLNASGLAGISTTGITKLALRIGADFNNATAPAWSSGDRVFVVVNHADIGGADTSKDPKLVVDYLEFGVTGVNPSSGPIAGGTAVTITGGGFVATPTVTFGGDAATSVVFVNSTTLTCDTPAHASGAVDVVVTNPDTSTATGSNAFTYIGAATPAAMLFLR